MTTDQQEPSLVRTYVAGGTCSDFDESDPCGHDGPQAGELFTADGVMWRVQDRDPAPNGDGYLLVAVRADLTHKTQMSIDEVMVRTDVARAANIAGELAATLRRSLASGTITARQLVGPLDVALAALTRERNAVRASLEETPPEDGTGH